VNTSSINHKLIRRFGVVALVFFSVLAMVGILYGNLVVPVIFSALALLGGCFIVAPVYFSPMYIVWLSTAKKIGFISNLILLVVTYYILITPAALLRRIIAGPPLSDRIDPKVKTYWKPRSEGMQPVQRFLKRY